ncbi:MAG: TonB-dependent receptor plug domain-containing protein, partial [Chitinophagales bacterium]
LVLNVSTDLDGFFEVSRVPSGQYEMTVFSPISGNQTTMVNVYDNETEIVKVEVGSILVGDGLTVSEIELDPSKPTVQVIDVDFLNNAPIDDIEDAEKIGNGITQDKNGDLSYRGSRPGSAVYYVDGMRIEGQLNIPLMAIREIEIYNGGIPAKYGDTVGGIVAIETKSFFDDY